MKTRFKFTLSHLGLLILCLSMMVLWGELAWPLSQLLPDIGRREVSERLWVVSPSILVFWYLLVEFRAARRLGFNDIVASARRARLSLETADKTGLRSFEWIFVVLIAINIGVLGNYGELRERMWMGFGTPVAVVSLMTFGVLLVWFGNKSRIEPRSSHVPIDVTDKPKVGKITALLSLTLTALLAPFLFVGLSPIEDLYHTSWILNEVVGWITGRSTPLDSPTQYGSLIYAPVVVLSKVLGWANQDAIVSAFVWLSVLNVIALTCFIAVAVILVSSIEHINHSRSRWIIFVLPALAAIFMAQGTSTFASRNAGTILTYFPVFPVRFVLPLALLTILIYLPLFSNANTADRTSTRLKSPLLQISFLTVSAFTMLNNFEFGAPLSTVALVVWSILTFRAKQRRRVILLAPLVLTVVIVILTVLRSKTTGESYLSHWIAFSAGYGSWSFNSVHMEALGPHFVVIVWAYLSIAFGLRGLLIGPIERSPTLRRSSIVLVYCGSWCVVSLAYFSGRSVPSGQLQSSLIPLALTLLAWSLPVLTRIAQVSREPIDRRVFVVSLLSIGLLVGGTLNMVDFGKRWSEIDGSGRSQIDVLWGTYPEDLALDAANENRLNPSGNTENQPFLYIKYPQVFAYLSGVATTGVINSPEAIVTSETIRNMECNSIQRQMSRLADARVFVHKDSLPELGGNLTPSEVFATLCPGVGHSITDTETFLIIDF